MVQPINYMQDVQTPFQAAAQGLQFGAGIQQMQAQQQEQQLKIQAAQAAREQQQALRERIQSVMSNPNPTAKDYAQLSMLMPKDQAESTRKAWDMLSADRQQAQLGRAGQVLAAFNSGANDIAQDLLKNEATALRNAGDEAGAKAAEVYAQIAEINPAMARTNIGLLLSQIHGGDKVIEGITKLGVERRAEEKAPSELSEAQSKAQSAAVAAKFAESKAAQDLAMGGWNILALQNDMEIKKQNARIAAANVAVSREGNSIKRQELGLKVQELKDKRDEAVRGKVAEVETARGDMDNFTNTVDRFLAAAVDKDGKPSATIRAASGPLDQMTPTFQPDVADLEALVETIGSQAFMAQIPKMKGTGALSEGEGKKLQASLQNFSLKQSPARLIENMKEAQRLIQKGRSNLAKKYGIPDTVPDTPQASTGAGDINALLLKYGAK